MGKEATEKPAAKTAQPAPTTAGRDLLQELGCLSCHSLDGSKGVGPSLQHIANRQVTVIIDGQEQTLQSDREYLKAAILHPNQEVVKGYPAAMPPYAGRISEEQLKRVLDFLMSDAEEQEPPGEAQPAASTPDEAGTATEPAKAEPKPAEKPSEKPQAETDQQPAPTATTESLIAKGEKLANQHGCLGCHSLDGSRRVGPTLKGLSGSQSTVMRDGKEVTVTVDSAYLERALRQPNADVVKGFPPAMPPLNNLSDADIKALIAWLESL